jgi:uncharacterized protein YndB with AHSA1/START domain
MSTSTSDHVYEIIVRSEPEKVWKALTDSEETQKYFFHTRVVSDWAVGSSYRGYDQEGGISSDGTIVEIEPQSHLKTTFQPAWLPTDNSTPSTVSWDVQVLGPATLLKLTHANIDDATFEAGQMGPGWVYILSSLKSLLETGEALPDLFN